MIRMIKDEDIFALWWWQCWYTTHASMPDGQLVPASEFTEQVRMVRTRYPWIVLIDEDVPSATAWLSEAQLPNAAMVHILTAPDRLKKGLERTIGEEILKLAKEDHYTDLYADGNDRIPAGLWSVLGFQEEGVEKYHRHLQEPSGSIQNQDPYMQEKPGRVPVL